MGGDSGEDEDKLEYMHKIKMKSCAILTIANNI